MKQRREEEEEEKRQSRGLVVADGTAQRRRGSQVLRSKYSMATGKGGGEVGTRWVFSRQNGLISI